MPLPPPYTSATGPWKGIELCKRLNLILQLVFLPNMWHLKILGCGLPLVLAYLPCSQLGIMLSGRCASISWEWCKVVWFSKVCPEMDSVVNYVAKIKHQWQLLIWGVDRVVSDESCFLCDSGNSESLAAAVYRLFQQKILEPLLALK